MTIKPKLHCSSRTKLHGHQETPKKFLRLTLFKKKIDSKQI